MVTPPLAGVTPPGRDGQITGIRIEIAAAGPRGYPDHFDLRPQIPGSDAVDACLGIE
jgi:hypothetical protein